MRKLTKIDEKPFNGIIARLKKKSFMGTSILSEEGILHSGLMFNPDHEGFRIDVTLKKGASIPSTQQAQPTSSPSEQSVPKDNVESKKSAEIAPGRPEGYQEQEEHFEFTILPPNE
jgi:hypothetical protein